MYDPHPHFLDGFLPPPQRHQDYFLRWDLLPSGVTGAGGDLRNPAGLYFQHPGRGPLLILGVFHLEWEDPTRDAGGVRTDGFSDASAVQMTADPSPPLFAMGAPGKTVHIWHWRALWDEDLKAFRDVESVFPAMAADGYFGASAGWEAGPLDDPVFIPARELDNPVARPRETSTEKAVADGFGTYTALPPGGQDLEASSEWRDGVWRLTLRRALDAAVRGEVALRPPQTLSVAFAVWDGSAGDLNGQKSVSIWNTLLVEE